MKKLVGVGILSLVLIGCEGNTNSEYTVTNNSSSNITVKIVKTFDSSQSQFDISSGQSIEIHEHDWLGGSSTATEIGNSFSEFVIINSTQDTCNKSHVNDANWNTTIEQVKKIPSQYEHDHTFIVTDSDF